MPVDPSIERRRTGRVAHRSRIILSGVDTNGFDFAEETETLSVSKHGLSVRTSYNLALGQEISVRTKDTNRLGQFEVAWVGQTGSPNEGRLGLEWVEPSRFWGIEFPPDKWEAD